MIMMRTRSGRMRRGGGKSKTISYDFIASEANLLKKLRHPNIIRLFGAALYTFRDTKSKHALLFLEPCTHTSNKYPFTKESFRLFQTQVLKAIKHLHDNKILHRDIKPNNILAIDRDDEHPVTFKLADFDLAIKTPELSAAPSGTEGFMAPEVCERQRCTQHSDMFSYAATVFALHQKQVPHSGNFGIKPMGDPKRITPEDAHRKHFWACLSPLVSSPEARPSATELLATLAKL